MSGYILSFLAVILIIPFAKELIADTKDTPPAIVWEKSLDDAVAKAKTAGKPVLLDFFAPT